MWQVQPSLMDELLVHFQPSLATATCTASRASVLAPWRSARGCCAAPRQAPRRRRLAVMRATPRGTRAWPSSRRLYVQGSASDGFGADHLEGVGADADAGSVGSRHGVPGCLADGEILLEGRARGGAQEAAGGGPRGRPERGAGTRRHVGHRVARLERETGSLTCCVGLLGVSDEIEYRKLRVEGKFKPGSTFYLCESYRLLQDFRHALVLIVCVVMAHRPAVGACGRNRVDRVGEDGRIHLLAA